MNKSHSGYHLYVIFLEQKCLNPTALKPPANNSHLWCHLQLPSCKCKCILCAYLRWYILCARACTKLLMIRQAYKKARILYLYSRGVFLRWQIYILSANLNSFFWKKSDIGHRLRIANWNFRENPKPKGNFGWKFAGGNQRKIEGNLKRLLYTGLQRST